MRSKSEANQTAWTYTLQRTPVAGGTGNFHHAAAAEGPSSHSQWSELARKKVQMSLGHCERTVWKQLFTPEGVIVKHYEGGHSRFLLLLAGWKQAKEPED